MKPQAGGTWLQAFLPITSDVSSHRERLCLINHPLRGDGERPCPAGCSSDVDLVEASPVGIAVSDRMVCATCGGDEWRQVVQHGSYISMCPACRAGPATSWLIIGPTLAPFRACVVDENWREMELVGEGQGAAFAQAVGVVAATGKCVELSFRTSP